MHRDWLRSCEGNDLEVTAFVNVREKKDGYQQPAHANNQLKFVKLDAYLWL